jgi:hypothetical protein
MFELWLQNLIKITNPFWLSLYFDYGQTRNLAVTVFGQSRGASYLKWCNWNGFEGRNCKED